MTYLGIRHFDRFHGLPVHTPAPSSGPLPAADAVAWRLECDYGEGADFTTVWDQFQDVVDTERVRALVIGPWWRTDYTPFDEVLELLVDEASAFPALRGLFLADVVSEECEVSWLRMCDITPVLEALPALEEFAVRGCGHAGLGMRPLRHAALKSLRFESGGLPGALARAVAASELPALERLDLWFGSSWYGGDATVDDIRPLLSGGAFPRLRHLGLQNSEIQDEIALAVGSAPVVAQLETLALSMGTLSDTGGEALLTGQPLNHLSTLDLRHHYLTGPVLDRIRTACAPAVVEGGEAEDDYADPDDEDDEPERYVAVSE
ncbi:MULTISPECIES: STM4015 family protein [unclassified Streptomyces]|uniref:STM4015 family protein n=1 Tax=unclassified Streptomyces TaxID=2593676 RepID=UPI0015878E88|nr:MULTISPECIES: STM4015 family protein [unclassified Streptomyces]NUV67867.1 leucine-rich repeat domain-containing protein [Streptomyces sp. CAI-121]NUV98174.1 leucine-rich repeat domain-containing protein [Streptomyces sp. CAI 127]NUW13771.1 leucine-rich repeat domain-containing protein [Streptomyces sp. CAI-68]